MYSKNKILVVLDAEYASDFGLDRIIDKVRRLAQGLKAPVELFCCGYSASLISSYLFDHEAGLHARRAFVRGIEKHLEQLAKPLRAKGIAVTTDAVWHSDLEIAVHNQVDRYGASLVVKACRRHHGLGAYLFGHADWQLIRHTAIPLLMLHPTCWPGVPQMMVAVDARHPVDEPGCPDRRLVTRAKMIGDYLGAEYTLFHAYNPLPMSVIFDDTLIMNYGDFRDKEAERHRGALQNIAEATFPDKSIPQLCLAEGELQQTLSERVEDKGIDIVVMGVESKSILDRVFIGSSAEQVLDHLSCDLLAIPQKQGDCTDSH